MALGTAALAVLAQEDWGKPAGAFPSACCSRPSRGALGHITGTSSNALQMNFLTYSITKKNHKQNQTKPINILFFF